MRQIILCSLLLLAAMTAQADDNLLCPVPVFAECPDTLTADCGDTIRYQFQLLDQRNGQPRSDARYFMAKGYGQIDSLTGEFTIWSYRNIRNDARPSQIGATFKGSPRPDTAICFFTTIICPGQPPQILGECPRIANTFSSGRTTMIEFEWESQCGETQWTVIPPDDSGVSATMLPPGVLTLAGNIPGDYTAYVILADNCGADTCEVQITITDRYPYDVRIEQLRNQIQGQYVNVDVTIDSVLPTQGLGGYDLLITFDNSGLALQTVTEGDIYEKCGWEYFTFRYGADGNCPECPAGLVRVIGIAETNNGDDHPFCKYPEALPATLFTMKFLVSNDRSLVCQYVPIRFFWRDCDDNRLMCDSGYCNYFMAGRVFDSLHAPEPIDSMAGVFPGTNGLPYGACETIQNERPSPQRYVDFYHGGIGIVCEDSIDSRGDVNLNGQSYELADIVLFARYFIYGVPVFTINLPAQIANSDVNFDNITLTIEDFCYMYQVIIGNELPYDRIPPLDTVRFELNEGILSFEPGDTLGAVFLIVDGDVTPTLVAFSTSMQYSFDGSVTRILICPNLESVWPPPVDEPYLFGGAFLSGLGEHEILSIETADYHGGKIVSVIMPPLVAPYAIRISKDHFVMQGTYAEIDVTLERTDQLLGLGGYNLLLSYNSRHLAVGEILPGSIYDTCAWEYFNYRLGVDGNCGAGCPTGALRVFGIAETNNGTPHPVTDCPIDGLTLFSVKFLVSNEMNLNCAFLPVRPFWLDCGDNTLSDKTGDIVLIAHDVYRYCDDLPYPTEDASFPGIAGVPEGYCPILPSHIPRRRWIDFYPGGVDVACADTVDGRGDLNLNGDPYEIADEELFARYLLEGVSVFDIMPNAQLATTDINWDNQPGTLEDFALFRRYACGYLCEPAPQTLDTIRVVCLTDSPSIVYWDDDTLGAILITLQGNVTIPRHDSSLAVARYFDGQKTHILLWPGTGNCLSPGLVQGTWIEVSYLTGYPVIKAVTYRGGSVYTIVDLVSDANDEPDPSLPTSFALHQNYPNPFNAGTVISFDLPRASEVNLEIINVLGSVVYRKKMSCSAGTQQFNWNGTTTGGQTVASGIYYYRLTTGSFTDTKKMLLLK